MGRYFYTTTETRYFDGTRSGELLVPDILSVTTLKADTDDDGIYDDETWVENTDFFLENARQGYNRFPKNIIRESGRGFYSFGISPKRYEIAGVWGYGDGSRADPWDLITQTATVADATGTTLTLSAGTTSLYTGKTIKVESEQMFISSYSGSGTSATAIRGVNGTTAAAHSSASIYVAAYPREIVQCCKDIVVQCFRARPFLDTQYKIDDGDFSFPTNEDIFWRSLRMISEFRLVRFA